MEALNDKAFIAKLKAGDEQAFQVLFEQTAPKLCSFISKLGVKSPEDAEELAVDTMCKVHNALSKFNPNAGAKLTTWVFEVAKNTAIDFLRKQARLQSNKPPETEMTPQQPQMGCNEDSESIHPSVMRLRRALDSLSAKDSNILIMKQSMEYEDIAKAENAEVGTVRVWYFRAVERLRAEYNKEIDNE